LDDLEKKYEKRHNEMSAEIDLLKQRYTLTVKELEDIIDMQKDLITKLRSECKLLNEQLEIITIKYK
jgi:hypothetical protein